MSRYTETSEDIERMFYADSYGKKKIASNVHRRTGKGSEKAGVKGGIHFAKNNFKRYEKNSKVKTDNFYENVLKFKDFKGFSTDMQKYLLNRWLILFPKSYINKEMGISEAKLNKLLKQFNIKVGENLVLNQEEMERAKQEVIPYSQYRALNNEQKYELLKHYNEVMGYSMKQLSEEWNGAISAASLGTTKSRLKGQLKKKGIVDEEGNFVDDKSGTPIDTEITDDIDDMFGFDEPVNDVGTSTETSSHIDTEEKEIDTDSESKDIGLRDSEDVPVYQTDDGFNVRLNDVYTGQDITAKVQSLMTLLERNEKYNVSITITKANKKSPHRQEELLEMLYSIEEQIKRG